MDEKKKVLLVMPWDKKHKRFRNMLSMFNAYAPLTLPAIAALIPKEYGFSIKACDEMIDDVGKYYKEQYDIVLISFVTASSIRAYEIAAQFKRMGTYVVFGGYHTTFMPKEAKQYADTIIIGEGEISIPMFIKDYIHGIPKGIYEYPDVKAENRKKSDRTVLKKHRYAPIPTIIANKGCPNNCKFCAISKMSNEVPRCIADVIDEMKGLKKKQFVFFDPNFFGNRAYALELMREIEKLKIQWAGAAVISSAFDRELMEAAQRSGCITLLVGLESINTGSLRDMNKGFVKPDRTKEAVAIMQSYGISVNGCYVLGFDSDTEEELLSLPEQARYLNLNLVRYSIFTPYPNSDLFHKLEEEGRIRTKDWSDYSFEEVVFEPKNMSPERLKEIYQQVWKETYQMKHIVNRIKGMKHQSFFVRLIIFFVNIGFKSEV